MVGNILVVSLMSLGMGINGLKGQPKERLTDNTITDLTNYQWEASNSMGMSEHSWNVNFTSNDTEYTVFYVSYGNSIKIYYNSTEVYSYSEGGGGNRYDPLRAVGGNGWVDEAYKTIQITGGEDATDSDLIEYLQDNGTLTYVAPPTPPRPMGESIITAIASGLGIIGSLATSFLSGFTTLFWSNNALTTFGIFALVMLGVAISFAVVKLVLNLIRSNTGA